MEVRVSKGFLIYAENKDAEVNYLELAYTLALSIKATQKKYNSVSLVTNVTDLSEKYLTVFDNIISIPWYEQPGSLLSGEHRWKFYHITPYDETIVLDSDMLLLEDIESWWNYCSNSDLKFCSKIKNYKLEPVVEDTTHRQTFTSNQLSNPYFALHYFKKSNTAFEFYKVLEFVCKNWEWCYTVYAPNHYQNWLSMDLATAISIEICGIRETAIDVCSPLEFVHMKPGIQGWPVTPERWLDNVHYTFTKNGSLIVGNIKQSRLFHYVDKGFINLQIVKQLEDLVHAKKV